ncbi:hypothetical protein [Micromonospora sp. NPDC005220]|uniref:hypothetical protein n=1 Tax=Micromonospora sp. NPDC005220 TaxID=3155589 RepID=UPI0033B6D173
MTWLPEGFVHPVHVPVPGTALHLRPICEADTPLGCVYIDPPERTGADGEVS